MNNDQDEFIDKMTDSRELVDFLSGNNARHAEELEPRTFSTNTEHNKIVTNMEHWDESVLGVTHCSAW